MPTRSVPDLMTQLLAMEHPDEMDKRRRVYATFNSLQGVIARREKGRIDPYMRELKKLTEGVQWGE